MSASKPAMHFKPRGLAKIQAASYIGTGGTLFKEMVDDGRMPKPRIINSKEVWDTQEIDLAFDELPHKGELQSSSDDNPWNEL